MGSSETGGGAVEEVVDSSVGSIVWVRRRNGSWWPGKVLGTDELLTSHLTSPRSGTPVKLLGREDASVDWYNLEKSKRVKAFRCGEFDECIERAEASQGIPPKKREKYARREDAILHALELERQLLEKAYATLGFSINDWGKRVPDAVTSSGHLEYSGGNQASPISHKIFEEHSSSHADKNVRDNPNEETLKEGNDLSGDYSTQCTVPCMKGLQDFGLLATSPLKEELSGVVFRAKRSRCTYLSDDFQNCLNNSVLQPSDKNISVPKCEDSGDPPYSVDLSEELISRSTEDTETDYSETDSLESDLDDDKTALSDGSNSIELQPKYPMRTGIHEEYGSISSHDLDELVFADEPRQPFSSDLVSTSVEESKWWQLKGKRNNRCLGKRSLGKIVAKASRGYVSRNSNWNNKGCKAGSTRSLRTHLQDACHNNPDFEGLTRNGPAVREYVEYSHGGDDPLFFDMHHFGSRIILVDVDLKVEASNYRRDVPMISLMSKLNGHAILGHPIKVEAIESGSSQNLLTGTEHYFTKSLESQSQPVLPRVWRTGRRTTNFRVPRSNISSALDNESKLRTPLSCQDIKLPVESEQGSFSQKENIRNQFSQYRVDGKSLRNSPKKISLSSNLKVRTLSWIDSEHKHHYNPTGGGTSNQDDVLMKTEYLPTPIACIPVTLVFSRLHEELDGRHQ